LVAGDVSGAGDIEKSINKASDPKEDPKEEEGPVLVNQSVDPTS
jgi:hypothetical protein